MAIRGWTNTLLALTALASVVSALAALALSATPATAATPGPGWTISSLALPTSFSANDNRVCEERAAGNEGSPVTPLCDTYVLTVTNAGGEPSNGTVTIRDALPAGVAAVHVGGWNLESPGFTYQVSGEGFSCHVTPVECEYTRPVPAGDSLFVKVSVTVPATQETVLNSATVQGGGAPAVATSEPSTVDNQVNSAAPLPFAVQDFSLAAYGPSGLLDTQAGDHPYAVTAGFDLNADVGGDPVAEPKDVLVDLPLGFLGDVQAAERCPAHDLTVGYPAGRTACPRGSRVGTVVLQQGSEESITPGGMRAASINPSSEVSPIYNLVPEGGFPAEFGFTYLERGVVLYANVAPTPRGYRLRVSAPGIVQTGLTHIGGVSVTFFGDPNAHNGKAAAPEAFISNPMDCQAGPLSATIHVDSWSEPGLWEEGGRVLALRGSNGPSSYPDLAEPRWKQASAVVYPRIEGCNLLQFQPTLEVTPTSTQADEPAGYGVTLEVPQAPNFPPSPATPPLRSATVALPPGVAASASAADGLQGCGDEQVGFKLGPNGEELFTPEPASCPPASQIGTVTIETPLLAEPLEGQLFLGSPQCDPCTAADAREGRMLRLFIQAQGSGVLIKLRGTTSADPATGQLTATFANNPQFPFSELRLHVNGSPRAPLANPQSCGTATTTSDLSPWSAPITPDATPSWAFQVDWNGAGEPCPASAPFDPGFLAQTTTPIAGAFSQFTLTFSRQDREQDLSRIQVHTPPGLLGEISRVSLCGEPHAQEGSCPEASRIGTATVAAGSGSHPFWLSGPVYLTGPYGGAPFGLSVAVAVLAGPFNLGTEVVRSAVSVDPATSAVTITSGALPQILAGVPTRVQTVNVTVDRPGFMLNPTSCAQRQIAASIAAAQGASAQVESPFAVAGCRGLAFRPSFKVSARARHSRRYGAMLDVKVSQKAGEADVAKVDVQLPAQLPSRLSTLKQACTEAQFAQDPAACPAGSFVGVATARTPVLSVPLTGPAILVSHGGAAFPDLVVILQGQGVTIDLTGHTDIKKGLTFSRFETVPDAPISSFELRLPESEHSALAANGDLCSRVVTASKRVRVRVNGRLVYRTRKLRRTVKLALKMPTTITGQNGVVVRQSTVIAVTGCPRLDKANAASRHRRHGRAGR